MALHFTSSRGPSSAFCLQLPPARWSAGRAGMEACERAGQCGSRCARTRGHGRRAHNPCASSRPWRDAGCGAGARRPPHRGARSADQPRGRAPRALPIDVIVSRNDTLDHIFRRLKLNLADLASLRALPGHARASRHPAPRRVAAPDAQGRRALRPRAPAERRADPQSRRAPRAGLKANVLQNPLAIRTRTISGRIDSSLFEAVEAAGGHDQTAVAWPTSSAGTSISCSISGPATPSS